MKVKMNQLYEQQNENNADFIIQQLKKEKCKLHRVINKYREMQNADTESKKFKIKEVGINYAHCKCTSCLGA